MKKVILSLLALIMIGVAALVYPKLAGAHMMEASDSGEKQKSCEASESHCETLDEVLADLLGRYQKKTVPELDCSQLKDEDFERLGDGWMEVMHPGLAHERMDQMMGGEGSPTLKNAHIQMGRNYLGCNTNQGLNRGGFNGMMGWGMMGTGMMGNGGRWGVSALSRVWWLTMAVVQVILLLLFLLLLLAAIRYLWKKGSKK